MFKKADFILLAALVVIGIAASVALAHGRNAAGKGGEVVLNKDGHEIAHYAIDEDRSILVDEDGEVTEHSADNDILSDADGEVTEYPADNDILSDADGEVTEYPADNDILSDADGEVTEYPAGNDILSDGSSGDQGAVPEEKPRDYNIVRIRGGKVSVIQSDCRSQVCVDHKAISRSGESIICLPHKLVVEIVSADNGSDYDTLAK